MTHTYEVKGMTCSGCQAKVANLLSQVKGVKNVSIDLSAGMATIDMDKHIALSEFRNTLKDYPKYQISEMVVMQCICYNRHKTKKQSHGLKLTNRYYWFSPLSF